MATKSSNNWTHATVQGWHFFTDVQCQRAALGLQETGGASVPMTTDAALAHLGQSLASLRSATSRREFDNRHAYEVDDRSRIGVGRLNAGA